MHQPIPTKYTYLLARCQRIIMLININFPMNIHITPLLCIYIKQIYILMYIQYK